MRAIEPFIAQGTDQGLLSKYQTAAEMFGPQQNTLIVYAPNFSTQRQDAGKKQTLGKFRLNLGEGYLLHGTPDKNSIGLAATHGCVRLRDEDIEWLYDNVPVGTAVYIY